MGEVAIASQLAVHRRQFIQSLAKRRTRRLNRRVGRRHRNVGAKLAAPPEIVARFDDFLRWEPIPPKSAAELAKVAARLCRLLRDEVTEQLAEKSPALTALAADWRKLLFPEANDQQFADGYAQAVTFGLLMARSSDIRLADGLDQVGKQLGKTNSLIGAALRLLTDEVGNEATLKTSLGALVRVLDAVNWHSISKGKADAWLYFYEDFLAVYDNTLRKLTGSYYTPPEVVGPMVRLVDDVLRRHFGRNAGLASTDVTLADPAVGTGTFILGVLRRIAASVEADQGAGAVPQAIESAIGRLIAFEMQLGPFAVAQLRVYAELLQLIGKPPRATPRMFVTDTLGNPNVEIETLGSWYEKISESRRLANEIKRKEPITVVIGNPPYKEKAKGRGGWIEEGTDEAGGASACSTPGFRLPIGASARTPSTSATSMSTSGAGRPGRSLTTTPRTMPASSASLPSRASSTGPDFSGCVIICAVRQTASG